MLIKYCNKCLQPSTRPNSIFDRNQICYACKSFEQKDIKIKQKEKILEKLVKQIKDDGQKNFYNCTIGVSGGKDSTRQAIYVRDQLKLKPLLIHCSYPPEQISKIGAKNIENLNKLGFDIISSSPSPITWKKTMKKSFVNFCNLAVASELALYSSLPIITLKYDIKHAFLGENPATTTGETGSVIQNKLYLANKTRSMNTLKGGRPDWLVDKDILKKKLSMYFYPTQDEFRKNKLNIYYLGFFMNEWSRLYNGVFSSAHGLNLREDNPQEWGDLINCNALDENFMSVNQMIKYFKFGFGKVTDFVNEEIRHKRINRNEAIDIVEKYDYFIPEKNILEFCKYLDISKNFFWKIVEKSINKKLFYKKNNKWEKKFKVGYDS